MPRARFYRTPAGGEVVLDFLRQLPADDRKVVGTDLKTVEIGFPIGMPLCRSLGSGLSEVRSSLPSKREARLIFFFDGATRSIVVVHAFLKATRTTTKHDIDLARKRMKEYVREVAP